MTSKPLDIKISFLLRNFKVISVGQTIRSLHSTVCKVDDLVLKVRGFDIKLAKDVNEYLKGLSKTFDFIPDFLGVVVGAIELNGEVKPAVMSVHTYAEPISMPSIKDLLEVLAIVIQAQIKGYTLDIKPSNFGKLRGRVMYVDEYGIGKPLPKDIVEDFEKLRRKIERYFKQASTAPSDRN
ncbi:MAG: hypothetical protein QXD66_01080 [Candidatus Nezhaarchaeales archaeon]|nr:MAG: hypothetical protein DSO06_04530 [Candidatus Nezhaarchaeota archaeon WYZ-LMO8]